MQILGYNLIDQLPHKNNRHIKVLKKNDRAWLNQIAYSNLTQAYDIYDTQSFFFILNFNR